MSTNAAAQLCAYLSTVADINYLTAQSIHWQNKQEANARKLERHQRYEAKWENAFENALDNKSVLTAGSVTVTASNSCEVLADQYAHAKVGEYNYEMLLECEALDVEYSTIVECLNSTLEMLRADEEAQKASLSEATQNTGLLGQ